MLPVTMHPLSLLRGGGGAKKTKNKKQKTEPNDAAFRGKHLTERDRELSLLSQFDAALSLHFCTTTTSIFFVFVFFHSRDIINCRGFRHSNPSWKTVATLRYVQIKNK